MTVPSTVVSRHTTRNWIGFLGDYVAFGLGLAFASTTTTLPAFAATLTDNKLVIGAVSAVWLGGWLIPQVFSANYLSNKPRKYPIMMWGQVLFRPVFPLFVVWMLAGGTQYAALTIVLFLGMLAVFAGSDAVVALAWFDLLGKSLPHDTRGRLIGLGQVITGVAAIGVGAAIRHLLGPSGPPYPVNYAIIFGLAALCYGLSTAACALIVETHEDVPETRPPLREYFPQLARLWREDSLFSRVTAVRLLVGLGGLAVPFYVVYATDVLHLPASSIGLFAGASTVGTAIAGMALGLVADRRGSHQVIRVIGWVAVCVPAFALLLHLGPLRPAATILYPLLYVMLGVVEGSMMLGFMNFVLEIAPPGQRPVYVGLTNTLAGLLVLVPLLGGYVLERTSYPLLFALAGIGALAGAILSLRLPRARVPQAPIEFEPGPHATPAP